MMSWKVTDTTLSRCGKNKANHQRQQGDAVSHFTFKRPEVDACRRNHPFEVFPCSPEASCPRKWAKPTGLLGNV
jgi:hypothetical protein